MASVLAVKECNADPRAVGRGLAVLLNNMCSSAAAGGGPAPEMILIASGAESRALCARFVGGENMKRPRPSYSYLSVGDAKRSSRSPLYNVPRCDSPPEVWNDALKGA